MATGRQRRCNDCKARVPEAMCMSCSNCLCKPCFTVHSCGSDSASSYSYTSKPTSNRSYLADDYVQKSSDFVYSASTSQPRRSHYEIETGQSTAQRVGVSREQSTNPTQPGKPRAYESPSADTISLTWDKPQRPFRKYKYKIRYKSIKGDSDWVYYTTENDRSSAIIDDLKSSTEYKFQVKMIPCGGRTDDDVKSEYSAKSDPIATKASPALQFLKSTRVVGHTRASLAIRKVAFDELGGSRNEAAKTRKLTIGGPDNRYTRQKTIMLLGETGSGKSALIDRIINYVFGVKWEDPFRFTLVDLERDEMNRRSETSQTQWITTYSIAPLDGGNIDFRLNIIDTPGYGDTAGVKRDERITGQIKTLFTASEAMGISELDAVCFIVKSSTNRLTDHQRHIFDSILSLFGKDIEENIVIIRTFSPSDDGVVLHTLRAANVPHKHMFSFENIPLPFHSPRDKTQEGFWKNGFQEMGTFLKHVQKLKKKSLTVAREVLKSRAIAELSMENLVKVIERNVTQRRNLQNTAQQLEQNKKEMERNKEFTITETRIKKKRRDLPGKQEAMNCHKCEVTCHEDCDMWSITPKYFCRAFDKLGSCTQCKGCGTSSHTHNGFVYETVEYKEKVTLDDMKKRYERAMQSISSHEDVLRETQRRINDIEKNIRENLREIRTCYETLTYKALKQSSHQGLDAYIRHSLQKSNKQHLMREIMPFL